MTSHGYSIDRVRKALIHFIGGRAVQAAARAILLLMLVRLLSVEDYGAYMLLVGLSEMMLAVASFGIVPIGRRYTPQMAQTLKPAKLKRFIAMMVVIQALLLISVTFAIFYYWNSLAAWAGMTESQVNYALSAIWLFVLVPAFRFCSELLDGFLEQGRSQVARALMPVGRALALGLVILLGIQPDLVIIIQIDIAVTVMCLLLAYYMLFTVVRDLPAPASSKEIPMREILHFGWHMAAVNLLGSASAPGAIRLVLANSLGIAESGLFAFLQSLQRLVGRNLPGTLLRGIVRPVLISRMDKPDGINIISAGAGMLFKVNLLIVAAGCIVIAVGGDQLVDLLSGGKFSQAGMTLLMVFLVLASTAQRNVIEMVMQVLGQTLALRNITAIAPLTLLMVWLFAGSGLNVAVVIWLSGSVLANSIAMIVMARLGSGFKMDKRGLAAIIGVSAVSIIAGLLLAGSWGFVYVTAVVMLLFLFSLWLVKPMSPREQMLIERVAGKKAARVVGHFTYKKSLASNTP